MGKGRSSISQQVQKTLESAFTSQYWGQELLKAQGLDPSRLSDAAPMDDGVPPGPPTNVYLTSFLGSLNVEWDIPPLDDHVEVGVVEYYALSGVTANVLNTIEVYGQNGYVIPNLAYVKYNVRVKFRDRWGHESAWSTAAVGQPTETADYKFDLERARQQGNLTSLIPGINEDLLAGENFAENTVRQVALAQPDHPNQLPLSEVDFDTWPVGQVWPPTDTPANSSTPYIIAEIPTGNTAKVVDRSGTKWLQQVRAASTLSGRLVPFAHFKERGVIPGKSYIASVWVQGNSGVRVRFGVEGATDTTGTTRLNIAETDVHTLSGDEQGQRLFIKFTGDATYNNIRLTCTAVDAGTTVNWTRFQLEYAGAKIEPSAWTPGIFSTGVVNARMLTAIDANIANVVFKDAAIGTAAIKSLTADKITAGTISTTEIVVASLLRMASGGMIKAGNTELDSGGLSLAPQSSYDTKAMSRDSKISDTSLGRSAIAFYQNNSANWNGIVLRADGDSSHDGLVALHATRSGTLGATTSARIELLSVDSGYGQVRIWQDVVAEHNVRALNNVSADNDVLANRNVDATGDVRAWTGSAWRSLLNHTHASHDHPYVLLNGGTSGVQTISGSGIWVKGEISAGSYYYNKSGVWSKMYYDASGYLYV